MIYDLAMSVRFRLNLIIIYNFSIFILSISIISLVYSLLNYNAVYSLLFFILSLVTFLFTMFLSNLNPFVSLIVGLIYLGVIVILFFFILLIINLQQTIRDNLHLKKISLISLSLFFFNLFFFILLKRLGFLSYKVNINFNLESFESLGLVLFNDFSVIIIILGLILFLGLISIVLLLVKPSSLKLNNSGRVSK